MRNQDPDAIDRVYEEFFAYLDGDGPRPDLSGLPDDVVTELEAIEAADKTTAGVDVEMIPDFDSDPVAVRLRLRPGVDEQRLSGGALAEARRNLGLSPADLAKRATMQGVTVTHADIAAMEEEIWSTVPASVVAALAAVLEVEEKDLRIRRPLLREAVTEQLTELGLPLHVAEDPDPVIDSVGGRATSLIVAYLDLRVRVVLLVNAAGADLSSGDSLRTAQLILRMAGDTSAVALVGDDSDHTTLLVEPADVAYTVTAPTGRQGSFMPARRPLPLPLAFQAYFERLVPHWDALDIQSAAYSDDDWDATVATLAEEALGTVTSGRFKIQEKKTAYATLGQDDVTAVATLVRQIAAGLEEPALVSCIDEMSGLSP